MRIRGLGGQVLNTFCMYHLALTSVVMDSNPAHDNTWDVLMAVLERDEKTSTLTFENETFVSHYYNKFYRVFEI